MLPQRVYKQRRVLFSLRRRVHIHHKRGLPIEGLEQSPYQVAPFKELLRLLCHYPLGSLCEQWCGGQGTVGSGVLRECGGTPGERGIGGNFHRGSSHGFWGLGGSLGRGNVRRYLGFTGGGRPSSFLDGGAAGCS